MNRFAIESLMRQREVLILRRTAMITEINLEIADIETGIERLAGKKVWETEPVVIYDDEHPHYINASIEEI